MSKQKRKLKRSISDVSQSVSIKQAKDIILKIKKIEGMSPSTIGAYNKVFKDLTTFFGEDRPIEDLTTVDARDFVHWQLYEKPLFADSDIRNTNKKGVLPASLNTYLHKLRAAFDLLIKEGVLAKNVFKDIKNVRFQQTKIETLSVDDLKKIFNAFDKTYYAHFRSYVILHTLLDTMGRINEVLHIKKEDVDFEKRSITFQNTKSKKFRVVPISKKTVKLLKELYLETEIFESEYIFLTNNGNMLKPDAFRKHLNRIMKDNGITKRIHPHLFRHSASELFLRQNGSIRILQKILGHSSLEITQRYAHVLDSTIREQHEKFSPLTLLENENERVVKRK